MSFGRFCPDCGFAAILAALAACGGAEKTIRSDVCAGGQRGYGSSRPRRRARPAPLLLLIGSREKPPQFRRRPTRCSRRRGLERHITSGIDKVTMVNLDTGKAIDLPIQRSLAVLAVASPDGSQCLVIDRTGERHLRAQLRCARVRCSPNGLRRAPASTRAATPAACPVPGLKMIQTGDHIAWKRDGSGAIVSIGGVGVFVADDKLKMTGSDRGAESDGNGRRLVAVGAIDRHRFVGWFTSVGSADDGQRAIAGRPRHLGSGPARGRR